jgi:iron complex outermembrane receptor protein
MDTKTKTIRLSGLVSGFALLFTILLPAKAFAVLEEVIVTAQKREENVQSVPIAVSAFSAEVIRNARMLTMDDISRQVPGFTVTNFNPATPQPFIRGIGSSPSDAGSDASVGVFIDGVYAGRAGGYRAELYDVQRIEVLRGPQGTLFGRNVAGGALNIITNAPEEEAGAELELTGGNYSLLQAKGMVTAPLTDGLAGRLAFITRDRDGHTDNTVTDNKVRDEDNWSARGRLQWDALDTVTALLTGEYTKDDLKGPAARNYEGADPAEVLPILDPLLAVFQNSLLPTSPDAFDIEAGVDGKFEREMSAATLQVDWDLEFGVLTSISGYRKNEYNFFDDLIGLAFDPDAVITLDDPLLSNSADEDSDQVSQELRLNSIDGEMEWTVGLYYLDEDVDREETFTPIGVPVTYDQKASTTSYAVFGQFTYPLLESMNVTLGARYSYDEKNFDVTAYGTEIGFGLLTPDPENPSAGAVGFSASDDDSWSNLSPKISLEYTPVDDTMYYFTVAHGYKSGGYNGQSTNKDAAQTPFDEEKVTNYEIGVKTDFDDGLARLNVAAFYMDYEDLQVFVVSDVTLFVDNAAEADIYGIEAEFYYAPTDQLDFALTYAYLDAELGNNDIDGVEEGNTLTRSPKNSASASAQYTIPLKDIGDLLLRADYTWQDKVYFLLQNPRQSRQEDYGLLNLRVALQGSNGWKVALWGKNITDKDYWVHAIDPSYGADLGASGIMGDPRTYGITGTYRW